MNDFTLHPESSGKPLKGLEQRVTQSSLWLRRIAGGNTEGTVGCGGTAGVGRNRHGYVTCQNVALEVPG